MDLIQNNSWASLAIHGTVIAIAMIVSITSFALLLPLDSVQAVSGVSIILGVAYGLSVLAWIIVMTFYSDKKDTLIWLNTHLMFLVILPATIGATAMNVTAIQNTRNLQTARGN